MIILKICQIIFCGNTKISFKISENISKSLDFSWFSRTTERGSNFAKGVSGGGGRDDQLSPTECKERLLKTNTLLRREGVIRILQSYGG